MPGIIFTTWDFNIISWPELAKTIIGCLIGVEIYKAKSIADNVYCSPNN